MVLAQKEVKKIYMCKPYTDYSAMQGPCDSGFHIPTNDNWKSVYNIWTALGGGASDGAGYGTALKMPYSGRRNLSGSTETSGTYGYYWSCTSSSGTNACGNYITSSSIGKTSTSTPLIARAYGLSIRPFKDISVTPTSSWTMLYGTSIESGGIFWSSSLGLISLSSDGANWLTMADKNLGATTVWSSGATLSQTNCGYYYQRGNNYGFAWSGTLTTSSTQVNASIYGPGNYYSSSTFIINNNDWSNIRNNDLRGYVTGTTTLWQDIQIRPEPAKPRTPNEHTYAWRPLSSTTTVNDQSGNGRNLSINSYVTIGEYQGVDCCYFNTRGSLTLNTTSISSSHTILVWVYGNNSGSYKYIFYTPATYEGCYFTINSSQYALATQKPSSGSVSTITGLSSSDLTQRSLLALVRSGTEYTTYLINQNGTKKQASTGNSSADVSGRLVIGNYDTNDSTGSILGGLSEFIIETSVWSEQDILDYYNSTKAKYGL